MFKALNKINLGRKLSEATKKRIGDANRGKKRSEKERERVRGLQLGRTGDKSGNWKGGISADHNLYRKNRTKNLSEDERKKESWRKNKRNRMKRGNGGSHTYSEWETLKAQYDWTCPCCRKSEPEIRLTQDHIIPVSKGGSDNIENIQPLCQPCNTRKKTTIIKYLQVC